MKNPFATIAAALLLCLSADLAQAQDDGAVLQSRLEIREAAQDALSTLYEYQPGARFAIEHAAGYAVFSTFGIKLLFAGGQQGKGVVVNNRTQRQTFMKMVGVQAGLGFGFAKTRLIFIFETVNSMQSFINQGWEFGGQAGVGDLVDEHPGRYRNRPGEHAALAVGCG